MIELRAGGKKFSEWESVDINLRLNTVGSTFSLSGLFTKSTYNLFKYFGYENCEIWLVDKDNGKEEKLITGTIVNVTRISSKIPHLTQITGASLPYVLETVNFPPNEPLQWENTNIKTIAKRVCQIFNLKLKIHEGAIDKCNEIFNKTIACKPGETIKAFLSRICETKGVTVAHDNEGNLFLYRILNTIPASSKITGNDYHFEMGVVANGQEMHSHVTAIKENTIKDDIEGDNFSLQNTTYTAKSPFIKNKYLPMTKVISKTDDFNVMESVDRIIAKEARNFPITCSKLGWTFNGRIVRSGFYLDLESEDLLIRETKFLVEEMTFTKEAGGQEQLSFTCLLPCVYTGKPPIKSPFKEV